MLIDVSSSFAQSAEGNATNMAQIGLDVVTKRKLSSFSRN